MLEGTQSFDHRAGLERQIVCFHRKRISTPAWQKRQVCLEPSLHSTLWSHQQPGHWDRFLEKAKEADRGLHLLPHPTPTFNDLRSLGRDLPSLCLGWQHQCGAGCGGSPCLQISWQERLWARGLHCLLEEVRSAGNGHYEHLHERRVSDPSPPSASIPILLPPAENTWGLGPCLTAPGAEMLKVGGVSASSPSCSLSLFSSVQSLSRVRLFATPWTVARQAFLSITNSQSLLKLMSIESVMPSNHLILCRSLLLLPPIPPSNRVFSNESVLCIRWPKYWSVSFSISPSNEYSGLISFRMDWLDLLTVQGTLKSLLQHHSLKASILRLSAFPFFPYACTLVQFILM